MTQAQTPPTTYGFPRRFVIQTYLSIPLFVACAASAIYFGLFARSSPNPNAAAVVAISILFLVLAGYQVTILPKLGDTTTVSDTHITQRTRGQSDVTIDWSEIEEVRQRHFFGRLEIISRHPRRTIRVERQIAGYPQILGHLQAIPGHAQPED